jgi:hypothetical protein
VKGKAESGAGSLFAALEGFPRRGYPFECRWKHIQRHGKALNRTDSLSGEIGTLSAP